jgi:hypothetical protein
MALHLHSSENGSGGWMDGCTLNPNASGVRWTGFHPKHDQKVEGGCDVRNPCKLPSFPHYWCWSFCKGGSAHLLSSFVYLTKTGYTTWYSHPTELSSFADLTKIGYNTWYLHPTDTLVDQTSSVVFEER